MGLLDCNLPVSNLGVVKCNKLPQMPKLIIETPPGFLLTPTQAVDPTQWQTALKSAKGVRIYLWPEADNFTDSSEKFVYQTTPLSMIPVRAGRYQFQFDFSKSLCYHKAMYSHSGKGNRIFILDIANQLFGTIDSLGNFRGFTLQMLQTEKLVINNGTVATVTPVQMVLADNTEIDQNGALIDGTFINSLYPLTDVTLGVVTDLIANLIISVKTSCDNTPILGLALADFVALTTAGAVQTITGITDHGDGTYTLAKGTSWVNGTVNLVAASALSLTVGAYEALAPVTITPV